MADSTRPTIILVAGAWMLPSTYENFLAILQKAGYPTSYASYPSLNPVDPLKADVAADSAAIREKVMLPLIETQGKEVVVVMHSYGGMPGSVAFVELGKTQRAHHGKRGGVVGLVFISGFVLQEGASVADGQGGALPPWVKEDTVFLPMFRHRILLKKPSSVNSPATVLPCHTVPSRFFRRMSGRLWPKRMLLSFNHTLP